MKSLTALGFWIALNGCLVIQVIGQPTPMLKFQDGRVWVTGLGATSIEEDQWTSIFRIYTQEAFDKRINQPVAGTYIRYQDSLSFTPDFSFAPGVNYRALFGKLELPFSIPIEKISPTCIETIHPQASVLPENMLRMYINFSSPMMPGEAYDHITLLAENGKSIEKAFLIIDQELWDTERKRFTLLFDPGRIKRGIQSNEELGTPLRAGQTYKLIISSSWRDAHGNFLKTDYTKTFTVKSAERSKLNLNQWKIVVPTAGTSNDLLIEFDRPIDYVLALKCITITGTHGKVNGKAALIGSNRWHFTPDQPWTEDQYHVEVIPQLEDVSGNNLNNVFDIDLSKETRSNSMNPVKYPFSIRAIAK